MINIHGSKVLATFNNYYLVENPTEKDMIISKNGKTVGKLTKISKYIKDDIKLFIKMVESDIKTIKPVLK